MPTHRVTSSPAAQLRTRQIYHKTTKLYLRVLIFIFFHHLIAWYIPDITCTLFYCHFFSYHALSDSFQVSSRKTIHQVPVVRPLSSPPHAGSAQSELIDCWSINTAKNEGTPATASSVDTARRAYAAGTCEKNTCNRNITVCKYLH